MSRLIGRDGKIQRQDPITGKWQGPYDIKPVIEVEYWRCELHRTLHFNAAIEVWDKLKAAINRVGYDVKERELQKVSCGPVEDCDIHRTAEVMRALFEVQGLPAPDAGSDWIAALESLIAKYAVLK